MRIIEIQTLDNGAHINQTCNLNIVPKGWAKIPDDMKTPNFPFGEIKAEEIDGVMTVTKWTAGVMPKVEDIEPPVSELEQLRADIDYLAIMAEVQL